MKTSNYRFKNTFFVAALMVPMLSIYSQTPKSSEAKDAAEISKQNKEIKLIPAMLAPAWGKTIKPEMQVVIEKLQSLGGKPIEKLDAKTARRQPTPTDAVLVVMKENGIIMPPAQCDTIGKDIPITGGKTHIRIYTPKVGMAPFPVIVYYHGGGFVIANIDVYSSSAQALCEQTGAVVVSCEYPKGPENKFPAAHLAAFDAYQWVIKNIAFIKGDVSKIAIAGESAGGNLAANVSMMARDKKVTMPVFQLLVYPVANNDMQNESYTKYAMAKPLSKAMMEWFLRNYLTTAQAADPRISLVKANLAGLPRTLIIAAEIDPLASEGKLLHDKLKIANVESDYELFEGTTHEFFGMATVVPQAKAAQALAARKLKSAFGK